MKQLLIQLWLVLFCISCSYSNDDIVEDIDGNIYEVVQIGDQTWMAENLQTTRFRDGSPIANVSNSFEWKITEGPAWVYYENTIDYDTLYGKLYNWYAVDDERGLCPEGWHVPDQASWNLLESYLGSNQGSKLKTAGTDYWGAENTRATNESGFSALPGGSINSNGEFADDGYWGYWWSSSSLNQSEALSYVLATLWETTIPGAPFSRDKNNGLSIRCIKYSDPTAQYYFQSAEIKGRNGDYQDMIQELNKAIYLDSSNPDFYLARSEAKLYLSDPQGAKEDINRAIEINQELAEAYGVRAYALWQLGEYEKAFNDLDDFIKYSDDELKYQGYRIMAELKLELEDYEKALLEINKSIDLAYRHLDDEIEISELYSYRGEIKGYMGDGKGMYNDFSRALELNSDNHTLYIKRGLISQFIEDHESAVSDFLSAINLRPFQQEVVMAYLEIGVSYYHLNNLQRACSYWDTATRLGVQDARELMTNFCK